MGRVDYYDDPKAPRANSLVPAASAIVTDDQGRILLHRRRDNEMWALPGGVMEIGESLGECAVREVREETGLTVEPVRIVGIYSDPKHVFEYDDGEVRQEFSDLLGVPGGIRQGRGQRRVVRSEVLRSGGRRVTAHGRQHPAPHQ